VDACESVAIALHTQAHKAHTVMSSHIKAVTTRDVGWRGHVRVERGNACTLALMFSLAMKVVVCVR
jgi:hypothetical protein